MVRSQIRKCSRPLSTLYSPFSVSCSKLAPKSCPPPTWNAALEQLAHALPGLAGRAAPGARRVAGPGHAAPPGRLCRGPGSPPARPGAGRSKARRQPRLRRRMAAPPRPPRASPAAKACRSAICRCARSTAGSYVVAVVRQAGRPPPEVLAEALPGLDCLLCVSTSPCAGTAPTSPSRAPSAGCWPSTASSSVPFAYAGCASGKYDARPALPPTGRSSPSATRRIISRLMRRAGHHPGWRCSAAAVIQAQIDALAAQVGGAGHARRRPAG